MATPPRAPQQGAPKERARPQPVDAKNGVDKVAWSKAVVLLNVVLIAAVAIAGFRYTRTDEAADPVYEPEPAVVTDSGTASDGAGEPTSEPVPSETPVSVVTEAPTVKTTLRADFTAGDSWPVGAGFREDGRMAYSLGVVDGLMVHGAPEGPETVSWLEKWTGGEDVRRIGARVLFAPNSSGSAAMTAWHTSVLETSGAKTPRTGMRLVVAPGEWRLVVLDGQGPSVIASGTYAVQGRSASFDLVRKASTLWVTDPAGTVTSVTDERVTALSGPWASWELREAGRDQRPAALQEIWAG